MMMMMMMIYANARTYTNQTELSELVLPKIAE